jgi:hypothetical protein
MWVLHHHQPPTGPDVAHNSQVACVATVASLLSGLHLFGILGLLTLSLLMAPEDWGENGDE